MIVQDSTRHFTLHSIVDSDDDMVRMFAQTIGMPLKFDTLYVGEWKQNLLLADSYGEGRVFIAGDAAHLVIPTGGLGMNSGVGDAIDLSWKLAATLEGWGGPKLLPAYTTERRKVGDLNVQASRYATLGRRKWRSMWKPQHLRRHAGRRSVARRAGARRRHRAAQVERDDRRRAWLSLFRLAAVWPRGRRGAGLRLRRVHALAPGPACGCRTPGSTTARRCRTASAYDRGFTLLRLGKSQADVSALEAAFAKYRAPFRVLDVPDAGPRAVYGFDLILLRPDMHVAWRGNRSAG